MKNNIVRILICILILIIITIPVIGIDSLESNNENILLSNKSPPILQNISVQFTKPKKDLYLFNNKIMRFPVPLIIGPITIETNGTVDEGIIIDRIELHIYNKKGTEVKFNWIDDPEFPPWPHNPSKPSSLFYWNETAFGQFKIKFIAIDYDFGINESTNIMVWKLF